MFREVLLDFPPSSASKGEAGVHGRTPGFAATHDNDRRLGIGKENLVRSCMSRFVVLRSRSGEFVGEVFLFIDDDF